VASPDIPTREAQPFAPPPSAPCLPDSKRSLLIVLPRFGAGGASKVSVVLAGALARAGIDVTLATYGPAEGVTRRWLEPAVDVHSLSTSRGSGRGALALLRALPTLLTRLRRTPPAVLMSAGNHANLATTLAHVLSGGRSRLVLKLTNPVLRPGRSAARRTLKAWTYRLMMTRADAVLTLSAEDASAAAALCPAAASRIRVVGNPYLGDSCDPPARRPDGGPPVILAVGRLTAQKNHDLLLAALARLQDRPWRLEVLGVGDERARLEARAEALGLAERVRFLGYVPDPAPHYAAAQAKAPPPRGATGLSGWIRAVRRPVVLP
jgi:glycosyltransferase involved in cell wall biosynthesis